MNSTPEGDDQASGDWAFSDEEAARDAGLIPPDPSTHAALPHTDTEDVVTSSSDEPTDDTNAPTHGGYGSRSEGAHHEGTQDSRSEPTDRPTGG